MKILRIIYDFPPPWHGLAPFPYELSRAETESGHQVTIICGHWPRQKPPLPPLPKGMRLVRIYREPFPKTLFFFTAPLAFLAALRELLFKKYDVIVGHGQLPLCFLIFCTLTRPLWKTPYYHFLHITAAGWKKQAQEKRDGVDFLTRFVEWPLHELTDRLGCRLAAKVFVTGENVKREVLTFYQVPIDKLVVLENGVNPNIFQPQGKNKRSELGFTEDQIILLYVGAHNDRKGLEKVLEAFPYLPKKYVFLTVGSGNPPYLDKLHQKVQQNNIEGRVTFAGYYPYPLPEWYRMANLLLLPSSYEGFPKVVLESLACGTPVLASGFQTRQTIDGLFLLDEQTPEGMAAYIQNITNQQTAVDREKILAQYSWQKMVERIQKEIQTPKR